MEERRKWAGRKVHMGYYQEAYDAECAAIARAQAVAAAQAKRNKLGRVRIFTDAQAAITRMTHDEPGPGQTYAIQARQAIAILHKQEPAIEIEIRWCPAHKGIPGERGRRQVGQTGCQRTGRPRGGMADTCRRHENATATELPGAP